MNNLKEYRYQNTVYISGQITGLKKTVYEWKFNSAERHLERRIKHYHDRTRMFTKVINPLKLPFIFNNWYVYMTIDLYYLIFKCDSIYMLTNWQSSRGAIIEHKVAKYFDKQIYYE